METRQRNPRISIPKVLKAARGQECVNCGALDGTTVAAHCNDMEFKGIGRKSHDCLVAYLCVRCHAMTDGTLGSLTKEEKRDLWNRAFKRTVVLWFQRGIVKV